MSRPLVAIDTNILVWGVRSEGTPEQLKRANWLFRDLEEKEAQVIVPAIVLSEYLVPVKESDHNDQTATLSKRFIIAPFDVRCASIAARLFSVGKAQRSMNRKDARRILKADCMIVASASIAGARIFFSGDANCRTLANKLTKWTVEDVPKVAPDLFGYSDD